MNIPSSQGQRLFSSYHVQPQLAGDVRKSQKLTADDDYSDEDFDQMQESHVTHIKKKDVFFDKRKQQSGPNFGGSQQSWKAGGQYSKNHAPTGALDPNTFLERLNNLPAAVSGKGSVQFQDMKKSSHIYAVKNAQQLEGHRQMSKNYQFTNTQQSKLSNANKFQFATPNPFKIKVTSKQLERKQDGSSSLMFYNFNSYGLQTQTANGDRLPSRQVTRNGSRQVTRGLRPDSNKLMAGPNEFGPL